MFALSQILPRARSLYADRLALQDGEQRWTFEALGQRVDRLVGALKAAGVRSGDRVGMLDVNSHRYAEAYYACAQAGMVLLPLNSRLAPPELKHVLNDAAAKALIVSEPLRSAAHTLGVEVLVDDYEAFIAAAAPDPTITPVDLDDIAQIYYTSGTTGEPKGVCLTHRNMTASALDAIVGLHLGAQDVWLHAAPMFHLVDAWAVWAMPLLGATQVTVPFTPEAMMAAVQRTRATAAGLPPALIHMLVEHPALGQYDLSSLRLIMYGGSPALLSLLQKAAERLPTTYVQAYGITETSGITTLSDPVDFHVHGTPEQLALTGNAGRPLPHIELEIVDDDGQPVPRGSVGEVVVRGPRVMREYWRKPLHTAEALRAGRYHTGDMGCVDAAGRLFIVDRKKDMIISGGENVYSVEVETVLAEHPAVLEVAVIGVPDNQWHEAVKAVVVLRDNAAATVEEILLFCRGRIAGYKIPKSVEFSSEPLPRTGTGKIAKRKLRDRHWAGRERKI